MHFVRIACERPRFVAHRGDRIGVERAEIVGGFGVAPAARLDGLRAALLERRIVEERIRFRVQDLGRERRRRGQVARDQLDFAAFDPAQQREPAVGVHRVVQAIVERLVDERMMRDLAFADDVLEAGGLIGEHGREQIVALHPLQLRRGAPAAGEARQRERGRRIPAPAHAEQRRVEEGLHQHMLGAGGAQVAPHFVEREAVRERQRQDDRVVGRGRLQFEVEAAAEALTQREPPRAVDAAAERRMNHQLRAARLVEETLHHERVLGRQRAQRRARAREVIDDLARRFGR